MKAWPIVGIVLGVIAAALGVVGIFFLVPFFGFYVTQAEGSVAGQVMKVSRRGTVWKTWEVQMAVTQSGAIIDRWDFSVDDSDPDRDRKVDALNRASRSGWQARIAYEERLGLPHPWRSETSCLLKEVELLRPHPWPPARPMAFR